MRIENDERSAMLRFQQLTPNEVDQYVITHAGTLCGHHELL